MFGYKKPSFSSIMTSKNLVSEDRVIGTLFTKVSPSYENSNPLQCGGHKLDFLTGAVVTEIADLR